MSRDKDLAAAMGSRRPRQVIQSEVSDSILGELVPVTTVDLPLDSLYFSRFQVRDEASQEELLALAESIQSAGLVSPVVVRPLLGAPDENLQVKCVSRSQDSETAEVRDEAKNLQVKSFELVTGHNRVQAALMLGWTVIPAVVKHLTDAQAAIALTADNAVRRDLTDYDRFLSIQLLEQTKACRTGRELAASLGISTAQISQLRAFGKLPTSIRDIVAQHRRQIGYRLAYELENSGLAADESEMVSAALTRLVSGTIKAQNQVVPWIRAQLTRRGAAQRWRRELKIQRPTGSPVRVVSREDGVTVFADGLNPERLAQLIEAHLDDLLLESGER